MEPPARRRFLGFRTPRFKSIPGWSTNSDSTPCLSAKLSWRSCGPLWVCTNYLTREVRIENISLAAAGAELKRPKSSPKLTQGSVQELHQGV